MAPHQLSCLNSDFSDYFNVCNYFHKLAFNSDVSTVRYGNHVDILYDPVSVFTIYNFVVKVSLVVVTNDQQFLK